MSTTSAAVLPYPKTLFVGGRRPLALRPGLSAGVALVGGTFGSRFTVHGLPWPTAMYR